MKFVFLGLVFLSFRVSATWVDPKDLRKDLKPVPVRDANISESEFRARIKELLDIYHPLAEKHGGKLSISGDWKSETLNAGANQMFGSWQVKITGGLARRPELTPDAFSMILCHELGHHFGGFAIAPAATPFEKPWAAGEGQADYYSTQVCARKIWGHQDQENRRFREVASVPARRLCDSIWSNEPDQNLCYRILVAVKSLTATMAAITNKPIPDYETPDPNVVPATNFKHPAPQCRMDTAVQAALCPAYFDDLIIPGKGAPGGVGSIEAERDAAGFSCMAVSGFSIGLRPACWFKPRL